MLALLLWLRVKSLSVLVGCRWDSRGKTISVDSVMFVVKISDWEVRILSKLGVFILGSYLFCL